MFEKNLEKKIEIAIIGGSGIYDIEGSRLLETQKISTPFGDCSADVKIFEISNKKVAFLARHGANHNLLPSEIPSLANVYALKTLGVTHVLAISAVGSLRKQYSPQTLVIPDQIIDRSKHRVATFFGNSLVGHITFAEPFARQMNECIFKSINSSKDPKLQVYHGGTYICIEGPAFSTKAESQLYRSWGGDIIGMTAIPEAKLVREAEMDYSMIAMVTDYDAWHESIADTSLEDIIKNMQKNNQNIKQILPRVVSAIDTSIHENKDACRYSLLSAKENIDPHLLKTFAPFYNKYWQG